MFTNNLSAKRVDFIVNNFNIDFISFRIENFIQVN